MIERATNTDIDEDSTFRLTAGNDTALSGCHANVLETASPSPKSHQPPSFTGQNPIKPVHCDGDVRRQHRAQPPARNTNPHSARGHV
jgi:hypothetical protein